MTIGDVIKLANFRHKVYSVGLVQILCMSESSHLLVGHAGSDSTKRLTLLIYFVLYLDFIEFSLLHFSNLVEFFVTWTQ